MFGRVTVFLLLAAAVAWASKWRANFIINRLLPTVGLSQISLHDISFDVDHTDGTFSGFAEFHLVKGTLGNLQKRVRRARFCGFDDKRKGSDPQVYFCCEFALRGLVTKYDVEVTVDKSTKWVVAEVLVDSGEIYTCMKPHLEDSSTEIYNYRVKYVSARMMPLSVSMDLPAHVTEEFEKEVVSRTEIEIARALNTTYKNAYTVKAAAIKLSDVVD